jgi:hypothetical protein
MEGRNFIGGLAAAAAVTAGLLAPAMSAWAQAYPARTITIVVLATPGGAHDKLARTIAARISENWKQPVIIDNRGGAGGNIGAATRCRSSRRPIEDCGRKRGWVDAHSWLHVNFFLKRGSESECCPAIRQVTP